MGRGELPHCSYYHLPSEKCPLTHPRQLMVSAIRRDTTQSHRWLCWRCNIPNDRTWENPHLTSKYAFKIEGEVSFHWWIEHSADLIWEWYNLALYLGISHEDIMGAYGINLEDVPWPIGSAFEVLRIHIPSGAKLTTTSSGIHHTTKAMRSFIRFWAELALVKGKCSGENHLSTRAEGTREVSSGSDRCQPCNFEKSRGSQFHGPAWSQGTRPWSWHHFHGLDRSNWSLPWALESRVWAFVRRPSLHWRVWRDSARFPQNRFGEHLSAPKSQRFLRFAIAMPIADPRNRSDFRDKRKQCCIAI